MSQARPGVLIALIVFAVFAAYAFLAPATYRTSALLVLDSAGATSPPNLPEPLEAARRLSEAVLDRKTLEGLSRERAKSSAADAIAQASAGVRQGLQIDTSDGRSFSISYRDTDAARAESACNVLTQHAAAIAPLVFTDHSQQRAADLKRQEKIQELTAFLALHPEVAAEPQVSGDRSPDHDPAISALNAEKANLEHRILELESGVGSDDPYVDPTQSDLPLLRRRLTEINTGLTTRRQGFDVKPSGTQLAPELHAQWKSLLDGVAQSTAGVETAPVSVLVARVVQPAPLPSSPIEPNRRLLLFFGVVFGTGLGTAFSIATRNIQRRRNSSRAPAPLPAQAPSSPAAAAYGSTTQVLVRVPPAPQLPSGLGPPVPVSAPGAAALGPSIIPIPQRSISSAPPEVAAGDLTAPGLVAEVLPAADHAEQRPSSRPAPRRFASTLVMPAMENPTPKEDHTADPALASATQDWDQQIRAHQVPGFAVVKPGSEPPPALAPSGTPYASTYSTKPPDPSPAPAAQRVASRRPNQMKVTQPLGSFIQEALGNGSMNEHSSYPPPHTPRQARSSSPAPASQYSYVSTFPPAASPAPSPAAQPPSAPRPQPVQVQGVAGWRPDPNLTPGAQRAICEQLYAFAVENCFVLAVVSVPESVGYKSRVAAEVALALADSGHPRILLMEGDLHRPWVQRMIGVDMPIATGFSQQLNARGHAAPGADPRWTVLGCTKTLHVLAEGMMRSPGLLLSRQFAQCLAELRSYYDFIVIDCPTASLDVESGAIDAVSDGLLTVCPAKGSNALGRVKSMFSEKRFSAVVSST